ncbi:MAG: hypothetical protein HYU52_10210 [Acidobacteria bacterium]|nr:hypothetical protein [Acidobacteriota bacterium]
MDEHVEHVHVHEGSDVSARTFILFFVIFLVFTAIAFVVVKWSYFALVKYENARQGDVPTRIAPPKTEIPENLALTAGGPEVSTLPQNAPLLQADPARDMQVMRAQQNAKLTSYGWIDREAGVVHVPIDKAMAFALERSMVKAQTAESATTAAPAAVAPAKAVAPVASAPAAH